MDYRAFEHLELIPKLLEKVLFLEEKIKLLEINLIKPMDLTTRKNVKKYLDISESTLINMMKDGRLKQGKHFIKEFKNNRFKIIFVESAIIKLKELKQ